MSAVGLVAVEASSVEVWTAIGTVGAVLVALLIATLPAVTAWRRRPRLELLVGGVEPLVRPVWEGAGLRAFVLRVEVRNAGRSEARRVRAYVQAWWSRTDDVLGRSWVQYDNDPMPLEWVIHDQLESDIPPGGSDFAQLSRYDRSSGTTTLCVPRGRSIPRHAMESNYPLGEHRARVTVFAENSAAVTVVVSYVTSHAHWISDVKLSVPPPTAERIGILHLLRSEGISTSSEQARSDQGGKEQPAIISQEES